jgi:hypothetical protein
MTKRSCSLWVLLGLISAMASGCCCIQGTQVCNSCSSCTTGTCGAGALLGIASCRSGCGEVYVDEWVSHPPCMDDCGYPHGACGRPLRTALRALWGTPYMGDCCNTSSCDAGGCSSCDSGGDGVVMMSGGKGNGGCKCGGGHTSSTHMQPKATGAPSMAPSPIPSNQPSKGPTVAPEPIPSPAPVSPSSAKRLSPAKQRATLTSHR